MNKRSLSILAFLFLFVNVVLPQSAFAIGKWVQGVVSEPPWNEGYTYISVHDIRYTVMKDAKIVSVSKIKRGSTQTPSTISSIHAGDKVVFLAEGNRIYLIKKIR